MGTWTEIVCGDDLRPGMHIGIGRRRLTVRGIKIEGSHVTIYWEQDVESVRRHRTDSWERIVEASKPVGTRDYLANH